MASDNIDWDLGYASESLDTHMKGTDEHKLSNRLYKTEEEIGRYILDEGLDEVSRAIHLLRQGAPIQKYSVAASLCRLLQDRGAEAKSRVVPVLLSAVKQDPPDLQIAFGRSLIQVIDKELLTKSGLQNVADTAKALLAKNDEDVREIWADVLLGAIRFLPAEFVEKEIVPEFLTETGLAQPPPKRLWAARVLGAAAPRIESKQIQQALIRKAASLCQDTDYEVRACMCRELNSIARAVGHECTVRDLLTEYVELIMDEESVVRESAIENIMNLMDFFEPAVKTQTIIPVWKKLCEEQPTRILPCLARHLGPFLWETRPQLSDQDLRYFTNFYHSLSTSQYSEDDTREMCAFNFPAIVKCTCAGFLVTQSYESHRLDIVFDRLTQDPSRHVRRRLAAGLHSVAEIMGSFAWTHLRTGLLRLFSDAELDVYRSVSEHLGETLKAFVKDDLCRRDTQLDDILFQILRREREYATYGSRHNWRLHQSLLDQFCVFPDIFGQELIHGHCVPLMFKILHENAVLPVKETALKCVCVFLRHARRSEHRDRLHRHIYELKDSNDCHHRLLFVNLCSLVLQHYSSRFFHESFFLPALLELVKDPVPNVRYRVAPLLPEIRRGLRKAENSALQARVNDGIGVLIGDSDMDVSDAARALPMGPRLEGITEQDLVTVLGRLITGAEDIAAAVADLSPDAAQRLYDLQDARKEEDEHKLTLLEFENEEAVRKRDMEDARAEFTKQLAEKSAGSATSGKKTKAAAACKGPPGGADRDMAGGGSSSMTGSGGLAKVRTSAGPAVPSAVVSKVKPYGGASTLPQFTAERRMSNPVTVSNASRIHSTSTGHRGAAVSSTSSTDSTHSPIDRHAMSASHAEGAKRASARSALSTARGHGPAEAEIPVGNRLPGLRTGGGTSRSTAAATGRSMYTNGSNASNTTSTNTTTTRTALAFPLTPVHRSQELYTPTTSSVPTTSPRLQRSGSGTSSSSSPSWMTTSTTSAVRAAHGPPKMNMKLSPIPRIATGGAGGLEGNPYGATPTHHPGSAGRGQREKGLRNHN